MKGQPIKCHSGFEKQGMVCNTISNWVGNYEYKEIWESLFDDFFRAFPILNREPGIKNRE